MVVLTKRSPVLSGWIAFGLGCAFAAGISIAACSKVLRAPGLFLACLGFYHLWEWSFVALFHPERLTSDSFLINHSKAWGIAWSFCILEYCVEYYFFPGLKTSSTHIVVGLIGVIIGQFFRTAAMYTAGSNFDHKIERNKRDEHVLITSGVYAFSRHPSYFGWYIWAISTQILLANPISFLGFTGVIWYFFYSRINFEEECLERMFGDEYREYAKRVPTRIPFI